MIQVIVFAILFGTVLSRANQRGQFSGLLTSESAQPTDR
ncbi:hypothetical protein [Secundilactobacillus kimchicus]